MKKLVLYFGLLCFCLSVSLADEFKELKYHLIQLGLDENCTIEHLSSIGLDFEGSVRKKDEITLIVNDFELDNLKKENFPYTIIQDDLANYFNRRYLNNKEKFKDKVLSGNFQYGSMAGFFTLEEIYQNFDQMKIKFPQFVYKADTIGYSFEKRPIISYCFGSYNDTTKPCLLITALHHSREPASVSVVIYFLWTLLEMAETGYEEAIYLLNERCLRVIPVVNPDGYYYNQTNYPDGGGMWRKNRRLIYDGVYGVDINRNYGPYDFWDAANNGSSTNPTQETYRGSEPFSEPETQAIANLFSKYRIDMAFNFHTYGNLIIYPWSALNIETEDSLKYKYIANLFGSKNLYSKGKNLETIGYSTRGDTDDWMYYSDETKRKALSFTLEVGNNSDSFWPLQDKILGICNDVFFTNLQFLWSGGANVRLTDYYVENQNNYNTTNLNIKLQNVGLRDENKEIVCKLNPLNNSFLIENSEIKISSLKVFEEHKHSFKIIPQNEYENGCYVEIEVIITQNEIRRKDTINIQLFHYKEIVLFDNKNLSDYWELASWGVETDAEENCLVLSDSPNKKYSSTENNYLVYTNPIEIKAQIANLNFETKWQIEDTYDFGILEISTDLGINWTNLKSQNMIAGSGVKNGRQKADTYGFAGNTSIWTRQSIDLSDYYGESIMLRFGVLSDKTTQLDGWKLKNIRILEYDKYDSYADNHKIESFDNKIYPNPAANSDYLFIEIDSKIISEFFNISIHNLIGDQIDCYEFLNPINLVRIPISNLQAGVYFIEIVDKNSRSIQKFIKQ